MFCSQILFWMMHYVKNIDMQYVEGFWVSLGSNLVVAMETCIQNQCGKERCLVKFVMPSLILHIFNFLSNNLDTNYPSWT